MTDLEVELERAVGLFLHGRHEEATAIGRRLLTRSRGTPHGAVAHRRVAEFLHATGHYEEARELAHEAGALARSTRNPTEILAAALMLLSCDLYEGRLGSVHTQLIELVDLTPMQPMPVAFLGQLLLLVGRFDEAVELLDQARGLADDLAAPGAHPSMDLFQANLMLSQSKAHLLAERPADAIALLERVLALELPSPGPRALATGQLALAYALRGQTDRVVELALRSPEIGRQISSDVHGHCLALAGLARLRGGAPVEAEEALRLAVGLLIHPLERQESFLALGQIARSAGRTHEAQAALRRAAEPSAETVFGRLAVRGLHELVGLRVV